MRSRQRGWFFSYLQIVALRKRSGHQIDQNKDGVWEHQDPGNPIPAKGTPPSSSSGARHAQRVAVLGRFPPALSSAGLARV